MTFIKTYANQYVNSIRSALGKIPEKYFPDYLKRRESYNIQPIESIHLDNNVAGDVKTPVSVKCLFILMAIAIALVF